MPIDPTGISAIAGGVTGLFQTVDNFIKAGRANKELKNLFKQRKAFQTPEEVIDIVKFRTYDTQTGYDPGVMDFLTGEADKGLSASLGSATRLGADPNALGGILDSYYQDIFKIGEGDALKKMEKFDKYTNALQLLASNKEAEWASKDNLIKDQMAAVVARLGKAEQGIESGANLGLNSLTTWATNSLYNPDGTLKRKRTNANSGGVYSSSGEYIGE